MAAIVTFDIPDVDMEAIPLLGKWTKCPDDDGLLTDMEETPISDKTEIQGIKWAILRDELWTNPYFQAYNFTKNLSEEERELFERLTGAQDEIGWTVPLTKVIGKAELYKNGLDLLGFGSAYLSRGLGTAFIWILLATLGLIAILVLIPL